MRIVSIATFAVKMPGSTTPIFLSPVAAGERPEIFQGRGRFIGISAPR